MANSYEHITRLVLSVIVLCLAAIVLPGVSASKPNGLKRDLKYLKTAKVDPEIWTVAVGILGTREEYVDPLSGEIKGYNPDIINAVCRIANKSCRLVQDPYQNCLNSTDGASFGGVGLFKSYYDACSPWPPSPSRKRTFQFTESYTRVLYATFAVRPGNPDNFDAQDLTGKKIGFVAGYISDAECIGRQAENIRGAILPEENIVIYTSEAGLLEGITNGEVDAGMNTVVAFQALGEEVVELVSDGFTCSDGGGALMARKDNPISKWFDPALQELLTSAEYQQICDNLLTEHGNVPGPDPADICV